MASNEERDDLEMVGGSVPGTARPGGRGGTVDRRVTRLQAQRQLEAQTRVTETLEQRDVRLERRRERDRQVRAAKTADERDQRLAARRQRDHERRAAETEEQREDRLQRMREADHERRAAETPEQREDRLQPMRQSAHERQAAETLEQRQERLQERREVRRRAGNRNVMHRAAVLGTVNAMPPILHNLGAMTKECEHNFCKALHFPAEKGTLLHSCCHNGQVATPPLSPYPDQFQQLLTGDTAQSKNFREHIRQYNSANAFASFGAKAAPIPGTGPYCFKISGEVYHLATSALVENRELAEAAAAPQPRYGQLFVYEPDAAVQYRMYVQENAACDRRIMETIDQVMRTVNPYIEHYRRLHDAVQLEEERARRLGQAPIQYQLLLLRNVSDDQRRYNSPTTNKECMYLIESGEGDVPAMDLAIHPAAQRGCTHLSPYSRHVDPMVFPILFPNGDAGFYIGIRNAIPLQRGVNELTPLQFYSFRIAVRGQFNPLHHAGKLFQQFLVHAYCIIEYQRLQFIQKNQKKLRVENYQALLEFLAENAQEQGLRAGNLVILPSSFVGGPRYMREKYYDAMSIVRRFGRPDLFVTFTCNPKWPEILSQLQPYQDASARPDIVARVFQLKVEEMMRLIRKENIFGTVRAFVYVIEFQKRGLPHIHSLFWLAEADQFHTAHQVDAVISAEIPDRATDPALYDIIMRNNIHGPCGVINPNSVCMQDGVCKKNFPKPFQDATDMTEESYPKYHRTDNSNENHRVGRFTVHNGWVVPYNPFLSKTFNAHINVEMCHTIAAIKYLCKYFMKGHDRARIGLKVVDGQLMLNEVHEFVDTRCITPPEAGWRMLENDIHQQSHAIYELAVHLPNEQTVIFREGEEDAALDRAEEKDTSLTAWFKLNQQDPQARIHLYQDIPTFYVMKKTGGSVKWQFRQRGHESVIGRVASVSPRKVERYHLRLLLLNVPAATSFEYLRTVNGVLHNSFREAARALDLVTDDGEWRRCMEEASVYMMPYQLRSLFSVILINCEVTHGNDLWEQFRQRMTEDFQHAGNDEASANTLALLHIQSDLQAAGMSCREIGIPEPGPMAEHPQLFEGNPEGFVARGQEMLNMLNGEQRAAADEILAAVRNNDTTRPNCFFFDGPGGTGKTFLYDTIINILRGERKKVLAVAYTGIAAILLPGGKTCHTAFRLPLQIRPDSMAYLSTTEKIALQSIDLIVWDEAPMASSDIIEIVDRLLRDLTNNDDVPFGGKVMLLGGDFRQVLPVIPHATRLQIVRKCVKSCDLFRHFQIIHLTVNMRARPEERAFADWLLQLGDDRLPRPQNRKTETSIGLPQQCISRDVIKDLYGDTFLPSDATMHQRVILCPTNEDVRLRNEEILVKLHGQRVTYKSVDTVGTVEGEDDAVQQQMYPTEFLNSVNLAGLPPHELNLKQGAVVMLIRNLCLARGLCNGTRLIVMDSQPRVLRVKIITGAHRGTIHFIPRITLNTKDNVNVPFNLCRRQFPVKLAYAMTINKAQGQTFEKVGVYLRNPVFTHGQLYVACSRVRSFDSLLIQVFNTGQQGKVGNETMTNNIVFKEVL